MTIQHPFCKIKHLQKNAIFFRNIATTVYRSNLDFQCQINNVYIPYSLQLTFRSLQVGLWKKVKFPLFILLKIVGLFVEMLSVIFCIFCLPARIEIMLYIFYRREKLTYTKCLRKLFLWLCLQIQYNCYYGILWTFNFLSDCITSKIAITCYS